MSNIPIQTRLAPSIVERIDILATEGKSTRAEVLRGLIEAALTDPEPFPEPDPLLNQIASGVGALIAKADAILSASRNANANAESAYANARLHARLALPDDQWQAFRAELDKRS